MLDLNAASDGSRESLSRGAGDAKTTALNAIVLQFAADRNLETAKVITTMGERRVLNLGFVGLGQAVQKMFQEAAQITQLPYRITAATEPRPQALEKFRREFGGEVFPSVEALCRSPNVDVVYIATGPELHREQVITAVSHGKHVIVEKPMALSLADCRAMIEAAEANGVKLMAGHTHSFDAPIRKMREIVKSGQLGDLRMISTWNFNEFNVRPWPTSELKSTHGPILNQGPHQVDIVRQIGGGMVRSIRATTLWDGLRQCDGGYSCHLEFEDRASATLAYDARGFFDTAELFWNVGEGGFDRDPDLNLKIRNNYAKLAALTPEERERVLEAQKEQGRYAGVSVQESLAGHEGTQNAQQIQALRDASTLLWGHHEVKYQPFFGLTVVHCDRGAMRQSRNGILIYGENEKTEIPMQQELGGRAAELMDMYECVVNGRPLFHDGRWGMATLEVCLAIIESAQERAEIRMKHQTPMLD
jgi:phthalate 4,5-cis-dihydrodiol dehydrogenase